MNSTPVKGRRMGGSDILTSFCLFQVHQCSSCYCLHVGMKSGTTHFFFFKKIQIFSALCKTSCLDWESFLCCCNFRCCWFRILIDVLQGICPKYKCAFCFILTLFLLFHSFILIPCCFRLQTLVFCFPSLLLTLFITHLSHWDPRQIPKHKNKAVRQHKTSNKQCNRFFLKKHYKIW